MVEIINCVKSMIKGIAGLQDTIFHHHTRHEAGGADEVVISGIPAPDFESDWTSVTTHNTVAISHNLDSYELLVQAFISSTQSYVNCYVLTGDVSGELLAVKMTSSDVIVLQNWYSITKYVKLKCWLIKS